MSQVKFSKGIPTRSMGIKEQRNVQSGVSIQYIHSWM